MYQIVICSDSPGTFGQCRTLLEKLRCSICSSTSPGISPPYLVAQTSRQVGLWANPIQGCKQSLVSHLLRWSSISMPYYHDGYVPRQVKYNILTYDVDLSRLTEQCRYTNHESASPMSGPAFWLVLFSQNRVFSVPASSGTHQTDDRLRVCAFVTLLRLDSLCRDKTANVSAGAPRKNSSRETESESNV